MGKRALHPRRFKQIEARSLGSVATAKRPDPRWKDEELQERCPRSRLATMLAAAILACGQACGAPQGDARTAALWDSTVRLYLEDDLWTARDMYDAGHVLMVPLHAAFRMNVPAWKEEFSRHLGRFVTSDRASFLSELEDLDQDRAQYLYLASRFVALASETGSEGLIPTGLVEKLYREVNALWQEKNVWWYERRFAGGIRERLLWKASQDVTSPSYYRAIIDVELFVFAMAADLRTYELMTGTQHPVSPAVREILDVSLLVYERYVVRRSDGTWLFQPGVWRDHPDYLYAGNDVIAPDLKPMPVEGIAEDTSHSHRFPVWLASLRSASRDDEDRSRYYASLMKGLEEEFFHVVLHRPDETFPAYRVTNFMDGRNGVYRWQYATTGPGNGCGPFQLSGILLAGWWAMLPTERALEMSNDMAGRFPLSDDVVKTYTGPNTARDRHPLVKWPEYFQNGFGELNVRLSRRPLL
jgi:hypothetical protein